jgi:hypothetical protein
MYNIFVINLHALKFQELAGLKMAKGPIRLILFMA